MIKSYRHHDLVRILFYLRPNIMAYFGLLFADALIVAVLWNVLLAYILKDVIDSAVQSEWSSLQRAALFAGMSLCIGVPVGCYVKYRINFYTHKTVTTLRRSLYDRVVNMQLRRMEGHHSGDTLSRMTNDLGTLHDFYVQRLGGLVFVSVYAIVGIGAIFQLDWRFGLISLLLGLTTTRISVRFLRPIRELSERIQAGLARLTERSVDLLQGMRVAKLFQIEAHLHRDYVEETNVLLSLQLRRARVDTLLETMDFVFGRFKSIGLLALGLYMLLQGYPIEVGTIAAIIYLQASADFIFRDFSTALTELQKALAGVRRVLELLDAEPEPHSSSKQWNADETDRTDLRGAAMVAMRDVDFAYTDNDGAEAVALQQVSLNVAPGQVAALVGPSGGGKSTLLKLLLGFYPVKNGALAINDRASSEHTLADWRAQIAYVPQEAYLFSGTIADNIRYGKPTATEDELIAATKAANAHAFILEQPQGYATPVGERGASLSGGQRQRIAIARALLKDAPILLLDEATSALDSESEQLVQAALQVLMQGRTTIAVAHRLSTIEHADCIYVLDKGRIVEAGRHAELLADAGLYHQLYHAQFRVAQPVP